MFAQWYDDQTGDKPTRDAVRVAYHGYIPEHATLTYIGDERRMTRYLGRMRWYDARLGRWLTRDPAGYVDGLNVYLFVGGNPLMFVDPTGLQSELNHDINRLYEIYATTGQEPPAISASTSHPVMDAFWAGAWQNPSKLISAGFALGREPFVLAGHAAGLISPETAVNHSIIMGSTFNLDLKGNGNLAVGAGKMAAEAFEGAKDTFGRAIGGDLQAIGDLSFNGGLALLTGGASAVAKNATTLGLRLGKIAPDSLSPSSSPLFSQGVRGTTMASRELIDKVEGRGMGVTIDDDYLNRRGANAAQFDGANFMVLRSDPRKIEVLEEFLHRTQFKLGMGKRMDMNQREIHVKDFMIRHRTTLGLADDDVSALETMRRSYERP